MFQYSIAENTTKFSLFTILGFLLFFPSITFGLFTAEIFPWAFIFALFFTKKISTGTLFLVCIFSASAFYTLTLSALIFDHKSDVIRSLAAYLNIVLIFACIMQLSEAHVRRLLEICRKVFIGLLILGAVQFSGVTSSFDFVFSFLVPRASGAALLDQNGRGVTLLASEPARAGLEMVMLFVVFRMTQGPNIKFSIMDLIFIGYIVVVVRSASASAFALFAVGTFTFSRPRNLLYWLPFLLATPLLDLGTVGGRAAELVQNVSRFGTLSNMLFFIANESGHRLLALYSFVKSGFMNPFGLGIGNWVNSSKTAILESGADYYSFRYFHVVGKGSLIPVRAPGVLPNLMLDIGIVGVSYFYYWVLKIAKNNVVYKRENLAILIILTVKIIFFGSLGTPYPWIMAALVLRYNYYNQPSTVTSPKDIEI